MTTLTHNPSPTPWSDRAPRLDPIEQMESDDRSDWELLRLVVCAAVATLTLAAASTLPV